MVSLKAHKDLEGLTKTGAFRLITQRSLKLLLSLTSQPQVEMMQRAFLSGDSGPGITRAHLKNIPADPWLPRVWLEMFETGSLCVIFLVSLRVAQSLYYPAIFNLCAMADGCAVNSLQVCCENLRGSH